MTCCKVIQIYSSKHIYLLLYSFSPYYFFFPPYYSTPSLLIP